ncbi:MAG: iron ABC transporter permease [Acidobacteriota bacterium]
MTADPGPARTVAVDFRVRFGKAVSASFLFLVVAAVTAPLLGPAELSLWKAVTDPQSIDHTIFFQTRLPRTLFAGLTGGALAFSGVVFQAVLRNPLASPFTLGVSGGASLGAVLAIAAGWNLALGRFSLLPLSAFGGALLVVLVVFQLSRWARDVSAFTLLLAGVVMNYICAAAIMLLYYFTDFTKSFLMLRWMMGSVDIYGYEPIASVLPFLLLGLGAGLAGARQLNVLSGGEEWAAAKGVDVRRLVAWQYFGASLAVGAVVAFSGPIGFVGLIVPHLLRLLWGPDHRTLLPCSVLGGGAFLMLCDAMARTLLAPTEMPVGILTAALGGPFFLWLLARAGKK